MEMGNEKCVIFLVRFSYSCRVICGGKPELRKKCEERDMNHVLMNTLQTKIHRKKLLMRKELGRVERMITIDKQSLKLVIFLKGEDRVETNM